MYRFNKFIKEAPEIDHSYKYETDERVPTGKSEYHSETPSGHIVRTFTMGNRKIYHFYKPNSKVPDIRIGGIQHGDKFFENSLAKSKDSTLRAHDAYDHLLNSGLHIHSDTIHSPAGKSVWEKLSKNNDIQLYKNGKYEKVKDFDTAYSDENKDSRISIKKRSLEESTKLPMHSYSDDDIKDMYSMRKEGTPDEHIADTFRGTGSINHHTSTITKILDHPDNKEKFKNEYKEKVPLIKKSPYGQRISINKLSTAIEHIKSGLSNTEAAKKAGIHPSTIKNYKKSGVDVPTSKYGERKPNASELIKSVLDHHNSGLSYSENANKHGITRGRVAGIINRSKNIKESIISTIKNLTLNENLMPIHSFSPQDIKDMYAMRKEGKTDKDIHDIMKANREGKTAHFTKVISKVLDHPINQKVFSDHYAPKVEEPKLSDQEIEKRKYNRERFSSNIIKRVMNAHKKASNNPDNLNARKNMHSHVIDKIANDHGMTRSQVQSLVYRNKGK